MPAPRNLTPNEASAELQRDPSCVYLDVRSSSEFASGHAAGAVNVPLAELDPMRGMVPNPDFLAVVKKLFPVETNLVVGCQGGGRSSRACMMLGAEGYTNLANILGGFSGGMGPTGMVKGWSSCGLPVSGAGTTWADARQRAGL